MRPRSSPRRSSGSWAGPCRLLGDKTLRARFERATFGFSRSDGHPAGPDHLTTLPVRQRGSGVGCRALPAANVRGSVRGYCRGGSPAGLYTFRRQGSLRLRPVNGSARDCPRGQSPRSGSPEFTRCASTRSRAESQFPRKPMLYPAELPELLDAPAYAPAVEWARRISSRQPTSAHRSRLYLKMHHKAHTPSSQVIFFPCSYVRPA